MKFNIFHYPRWLSHLWAIFAGYFWISCPVCGRKFGGHECAEATLPNGYAVTLVRSSNSYPNIRRSDTERLICWRCQKRVIGIVADEMTRIEKLNWEWEGSK